MALDRVGRFQPLTGVSGVSEASSTQKAQTAQPLKFSKSKPEVERFNNFLKQSPLDDRIPTTKSLAKLGYQEVTGRIFGAGKWFTDKQGNTINIVEFTNKTTGETTTSVNYTAKNGTFHRINYDPDGNPFSGTVIINSQRPGDPTETFEYEYDIEGNAFVTKYKSENYSLPPQ